MQRTGDPRCCDSSPGAPAPECWSGRARTGDCARGLDSTPWPLHFSTCQFGSVVHGKGRRRAHPATKLLGLEQLTARTRPKESCEQCGSCAHQTRVPTGNKAATRSLTVSYLLPRHTPRLRSTCRSYDTHTHTPLHVIIDTCEPYVCATVLHEFIVIHETMCVSVQWS